MKKDLQKEFLIALFNLKEYWLNEKRAVGADEKLTGFIHSILVMFDGCSGVNDFTKINLVNENGETINGAYGGIKDFDESTALHEQWGELCRDMDDTDTDATHTA